METRKCVEELCTKCAKKNTTGFRKAFRGQSFENASNMKLVLEIINNASSLGLDTDFEEYINGCSWFFIISKDNFVYAHNVTSNNFVVYLPESDFFELDRNTFMNDAGWYKQIIKVLYT